MFATRCGSTRIKRWFAALGLLGVLLSAAHAQDLPVAPTLSGAALSVTQAPEYTLTPSNGGVSLNPRGAWLEVAFRSASYPDTVRLFATLGYDESFGLDGPYGSLRYEVDTKAQEIALTCSARAGVWSYNPHRAGIATAVLGVSGSAQARLELSATEITPRLELGIIRRLPEGSALALDARGNLSASRQVKDRWGYRQSGWESSLTGLLNTLATEPSSALWLELATTQATLPLEAALTLGYRPEWPIPLPTTADWGALATLGTHTHLSVPFTLVDGVLALERLSVEPRLRLWSDPALSVGGDVAFSLDAEALGRPVTGLFTLGYAGSTWFRFGVRVGDS